MSLTFFIERMLLNLRAYNGYMHQSCSVCLVTFATSSYCGLDPHVRARVHALITPNT